MRRDELSNEARDALKRENRRGFVRSLLIAFALAAPFSFMQRFMNPIVSWIAFGLPMGLAIPWLHIVVLDRLKRKSLLLTIVLQTVFYALTISACLMLSMFIAITVASQEGFSDSAGIWLDIVTRWEFLIALPGAVMLVLPIRFFFALSQKLGPGVLGKWLRGYYHEPREEERIFMFLDMKDSTTLAEQLGNLKFSALVRDFFEDMTLPVLQTRAEVSHYIGDEAVLTWTMAKGIEKANCVRLFFEFEKSIQRRAPYYVKEYGLVPGFKAGAHYGLVVATEVGEVKSEIVFHGDVLNTAARIQGLCNSTGEALLLSKALAEKLILAPGMEAINLGTFELKGKEEPVGIVAVAAV